MKDKYGVNLEVGDIVIVNNNIANIFERGIIEEISENVVMGLLVAETAFVNYGDIDAFSSSEIIYIEWYYMKLSEKDLSKLATILKQLMIENDKGNNFDTVVVPVDTFETKFSEFEINQFDRIQFRESSLIEEGRCFFVNSKAYLY